MNKWNLVLTTFVLTFTVLTYGQQETEFKLTHKPYIQAVTDSSASIVWTTNKPAIAWVELAPDDSTHFYHQERKKIFSTKDGFKQVDSVHRVDLTKLDSGTKYRYRIYNQEVKNHEWVNVEYGKAIGTDVFREKPLEFRTIEPTNKTNFAVINDIHERNEVMNNLLDVAEIPDMDFIVFNGDMVDNLMDESQMFDGFLDTAIERFASEQPFYYARGNHETRGPFASEFSKYFPTPNNKLYYFLTHGEAAIIVLDTGEDKPDNDIEYSGIVDMDNYRAKQAEWLKRIVDKSAFKNAKYKIVIGHIPPLGRWHGEQELLDKFVPILNDADIDIMLSAHYHRHKVKESDNQIQFPVIVNSNNNVLIVKLDETEGMFKVLNQDKELVEELIIEPN